jgi:two-component system chemotaxis response regulator CheY
MQCCLIVASSDLIRRVAAQFTERAGFMVIQTENGHQALQACAVRMPDIILLDWQLPVMSAHEFLGELQLMRPSAKPQILYMMSELDINDLTQAHAAGISDFLLKPFNREMLTTKLEELARARHAIA